LLVGSKKVRPTETNVYVFNDIILLAKKRKERHRIQLAKARVIVVAEEDSMLISTQRGRVRACVRACVRAVF
jgi:hypothetical protein